MRFEDNFEENKLPLEEKPFEDLSCIFEDEVAKYRKKKGKNKSRPSKSKHKHQYEEVLVRTFINDHEHYYLGKACVECGKVIDVKFFLSEKLKDGVHRMLRSNEILEKYKHLRIVDKRF